MYVWRVASALKWGLADCESLSVEADKQTLTPEDFANIMDLLKFRPMQLAIILKALVVGELIENAFRCSSEMQYRSFPVEVQ